jgi:hypothetical protein
MERSCQGESGIVAGAAPQLKCSTARRLTAAVQYPQASRQAFEMHATSAVDAQFGKTSKAKR